MIEIAFAQTEAQVEHFITLSQEYVAWMTAEIQKEYPALDIHEFISEHAYDDIHKKYPGEHIPPDGCLLIALSDQVVCGCVALGRLTGDICEMRTLYVRPALRGAGIGKKLVEASLNEARKLNYHFVRLDTLGFMKSALSLYRSQGFYDIDAYNDVSDSLKQYICFLELKLAET
jgi:N-acetylglutamate synthase-like GNAT family acetyltransferase